VRAVERLVRLQRALGTESNSTRLAHEAIGCEQNASVKKTLFKFHSTFKRLPSLGGGGGAGISRFSLLSLGAAMAAAGAVPLASCTAGRQNMAGAGLEPEISLLLLI